jgi:outer membrane biosynthesis protein TonB
MSLIDEALKRARQEAARQDAAAREDRYKQVPVIPGLRSRPTRSRLPLVLSAVVTACLAAGIAIGMGLSRDDSRDDGIPEETRVAQAAPETRVAEVPQVQPAPPPVPPTAPVLEEEVEEAPEPTAPPIQEAPAAPVPPDPAEEAARIAAQRAAQREIQLPPAQPEPRIEIQPSRPPVEEPSIGPAVPAPVVPAQPAPAAPADESGTVRTFQREMPVQGGTLRLNGIAFSDQPVALFDDKVLAPGESIAGYKVVAIEPKRVQLEGPGGVVFVELP